MNPIPILRGCTGIDTRLDPYRLPNNSETLISTLALAINVEIDDTGRISRRKPYTAQTVPINGSVNNIGASHSLYCNGGHALFIYGGALFHLGEDLVATGIRSGLTVGAKMYYAQVGDNIYYSNGYEKGIYNQETEKSTPWVASDYVGPTTTKTFSDPPLGIHLETFNGRIYLSTGSTIWFSEPFAYGWFDYARSFIPMPGHVRMIRGIVDGLWVSTDSQIFFLQGKSPTGEHERLSFEMIKCADYPAIEGTDITIEGVWIGKGIKEKAAIWTSSTGICAGLPSGEFQNLTQKKIVLPASQRGAAGFIDDKYITLLEP